MKVSIIGMGEIGSALAHVLKNQPNVTLTCWDKNASKLPDQITLEASLVAADLVFICVPSWNLRGALMGLVQHLKPEAGIITLAKGIEKESCKIADQVLADQITAHPYGVLGGPMLAEEILANKFTGGVLASNSAKLKALVKQTFKGSQIKIVTTSDVRGISLCGVLKNTYTLSVGIAEGLGLGENAKGVLFSQALGEMRIIMGLLGGKTSTVLGLGGAGDFFATSQSPHSRNRMIGITLATGADGHLESEGFISLACLPKLLPAANPKLPLLNCLHKIAYEQAPPALLKQVIFDQVAQLA
mgnify:CR=1 FL=1